MGSSENWTLRKNVAAKNFPPQVSSARISHAAQNFSCHSLQGRREVICSYIHRRTCEYTRIFGYVQFKNSEQAPILLRSSTTPKPTHRHYQNPAAFRFPYSPPLLNSYPKRPSPSQNALSFSSAGVNITSILPSPLILLPSVPSSVGAFAFASVCPVAAAFLM